MLRNLRYALRALARAPALTATVVLTLALAIGANSAVFSAIDAVLLEPLPFPEGDRLVRLTEVHGTSEESGVALRRLEDWTRLSSTFEAITSYAAFDASDTTGELPERVRAAGVTPRFLEVWGVAPGLGRGFTAAEHESGGPCARLVSERYWRTRLDADPEVLGRTIRINGASCPVVGVMPVTFRFPDRDVDVWTPAPIDAAYEGRARFSSYRTAVGRLESGVTLEQALADLNRVRSALGEQYPETDAQIDVRIVPLIDTVVGGADGTLWLLFAAVSVLLLIACTNIAALLLARVSRREQEIAIRHSLGASRAIVVVQMLIETGVLAFAGAALGLLVAAGASTAFAVLAPELPRLGEIGLDARIVFYTGAIAVAVTLICGLVPALRGTRGVGFSSRAGRTQISPGQPLQWGLVGAQVALSVTLLAAAGLLLRSFDTLSRVDPGFDPNRVLVFRMSQVYNEPSERWAPRIDGWLGELDTLPGVEAAGAAFLRQPGLPEDSPEEFVLDGRRADAQTRNLVVEHRIVSPSYFAAMGMPTLAGELCRRPAEQPGDSLIGEVMVNRRFVDRHSPERSAIGRRLTRQVPPEFGGGLAVGRIAGIVGDARERGLHRDPVPTVYTCETADPNPWFLVRTSGDLASLASSVRRKMQELAPLQSVYPIAPLEQQIESVYAENRLRTVVLAAFAVTALSLTSLGIYGTLSYIVGLRRREVGLRVALGAPQRNIVWHYLTKASRVVGLACVAGLGLSLISARGLSGMLYGISPSDPITLAGVLAIVLGVALPAAWLPARRAARIDPMHALREE